MKKIIMLVVIAMITFSCNNDSSELLIESNEKAKNTSSILTEFTGNIPEACKQVCLVAGQHMYVGTVDVAENNGDLYVTYNVTDPNVYLEEVHLDIFNSIGEFKSAKKISNGGAIPGKFEYKKEFASTDMVNSHTVLIPKSYVDANGGADCIFIASHAALSNGETAWGGLCDASSDGVTNLDEAKQFPGRNWSVYFEFCAEECSETINFTYAWEDLQNIGNDADYNDLVIKADVIRSSSELKVTFLAKARGAAFDHEFKFNIPAIGVNGIFGADNVQLNGAYYTVTVFESTKAVLPAENVGSNGYSANTEEGDITCNYATKEIVITTNSDFSFNTAIPYEPFITVSPFQPFGTEKYDLYIYEISGRDTWKDSANEEFPNGIVIPLDWKWPLEEVNITIPYPDFTSLTAGFTNNWANNLADPSKVFDCN